MRISRHKLLRNSIGWGLLAGLFGNKTSLLNAAPLGTGTTQDRRRWTAQRLMTGMRN